MRHLGYLGYANGDHDAICAGGGRLMRRHDYARDTLFGLLAKGQMCLNMEIKREEGERQRSSLFMAGICLLYFLSREKGGG